MNARGSVEGEQKSKVIRFSNGAAFSSQDSIISFRGFINTMTKGQLKTCRQVSDMLQKLQVALWVLAMRKRRSLLTIRLMLHKKIHF